MTWAVFAAAAVSALLHAGWNLTARLSAEPRDMPSGIALATASLCAVVFPAVGPPIPSTWPWIGVASACNVLFLRMLGIAYERHSFVAVYAIVRATVPLMLFLMGWLAFSERSQLGALAGLVVIVLSIIIFAVPRGAIERIDCATLGYSVMAGLVLAFALFFDVQGIRAGGGGLTSLTQYAVASSLMTATGVSVLACLKRTNPIATLVEHARYCYAGAILLLSSYLLGMWAYAQGPVGLVAPVRESSILFGGVLAVTILKERVTEMQWVAILLATVGIVLVQAG